MMRAYTVTVVFLDSDGAALALSNIDCKAVDPGAACASAYTVSRADVQGRVPMRNVRSVQFNVKQFAEAQA